MSATATSSVTSSDAVDTGLDRIKGQQGREQDA
jgi:hypothetical protein